MITENEFMAIVSRRKPRHNVNTMRYVRVHMCEPPDDKVQVWSFEYENTIVSVRAPYRSACDAAVRYFGDTVDVPSIMLLPRPHKHGDEAIVARV